MELVNNSWQPMILDLDVKIQTHTALKHLHPYYGIMYADIVLLIYMYVVLFWNKW